MDAIVDRVIVSRKNEKAIKAALAATLLVGDGLMQIHVLKSGKGGQGARRRRRSGPRQVLSRPVQRDASLHLRRDRARIFRLQQSRERVPHVRRPRRAQADASRAARARHDAQHRRRLLREGRVQLQPGHVGRPGDVQPEQGAALLDRHALAGSVGQGARRDPQRHRSQDQHRLSARREGPARRLGEQEPSASAASRGGSSVTIAATASAAKRTPAWKRGSTT